MANPADNPLLPDPDRLRARLAEIAREQEVLRKVLRAVVRSSAALSLTQTDDKKGGRRDA